MENKDEVLATVEFTDVKKTCKCCGKALPINNFRKHRYGYRNKCISCERKEKGVDSKFSIFTSRELIEELKSRGYTGTLKYIKVETINI